MSPRRARVGERLVSLVQRVMLRTGRGPLRPFWWLAHEALARTAGLYLRGLHRRTAVYARASLGARDLLYGLSDFDLALALPGGEGNTAADREGAQRRFQRLRRALPLVSELMLDSIQIDEEGDLHAASTAPVFACGPDGRAGRPAFQGPEERPTLHERPGLYGPLWDWRLLAGPEYRPPPRDWEPVERSIAAWLELQFWWRQAFRASLDPTGRRKPYLCVKLVAEPARILLWLLHRERIVGRKAVLERALRRIPEEEASLRLAIGTLERLPNVVEAPLNEALSSLVRQSCRIAEVLAEETASTGVTPVRLVRTGGGLRLPPGADAPLRSLLPDGAEPQLLPLTDWRARAVPSPFEPDESFALIPGDPAMPATLGRAAEVSFAGPYPALRSRALLVLAAGGWERGRLRAAQCAVSDPVSFALLAGHDAACFPNATGWSARDSAERALAEHRAWLAAHGSEPTGKVLARLMAAARAAQFWSSIEEREPALPLTLADAGRLLGDGDPRVRSLAEQACGEYAAYRVSGYAPTATTVTALHREIIRLPAYAACAS